MQSSNNCRFREESCKLNFEFKYVRNVNQNGQMINRPNNNVNLSDVAEAVQINNLHQRLERMNMTRVNTIDSGE